MSAEEKTAEKTYRPFLTGDGMRFLDSFNVYPSGLGPEGGMVLACQAPDCAAVWPWPGHVMAPDLRQLCVVATRHWNEVHA